jgi:hypothetical protein
MLDKKYDHDSITLLQPVDDTIVADAVTKPAAELPSESLDIGVGVGIRSGLSPEGLKRGEASLSGFLLGGREPFQKPGDLHKLLGSLVGFSLLQISEEVIGHPQPLGRQGFKPFLGTA